MVYVGYHRTSTKQQNLDRGVSAIEDFCKENNLPLKKIYTDQSSGRDFKRTAYLYMKEDVLREGDTLIISEVDRLGRNKKEVLEELKHFSTNGIRVMILELPTTLMEMKGKESTATLVLETINGLLIEIYAMLAQAEYEKSKKRQAEGIQKKKDRGEWGDFGRPRKMSKEDFERQYGRVQKGEIGSLALMRELDMNQSTYFRYVRELKNAKK